MEDEIQKVRESWRKQIKFYSEILKVSEIDGKIVMKMVSRKCGVKDVWIHLPQDRAPGRLFEYRNELADSIKRVKFLY